MHPIYSVAISYAGENAALAKDVKAALEAWIRPAEIFLAGPTLQSEPLAITLGEIFNTARCIIVLLDSHYAEKQKVEGYVRKEFAAACAKAPEAVVVFRIGGAPIPAAWDDRRFENFESPNLCAQTTSRVLMGLGIELESVDQRESTAGFEHLVGLMYSNETSKHWLERVFDLVRPHLHAGQHSHAQPKYLQIDGSVSTVTAVTAAAKHCLLVVGCSTPHETLPQIPGLEKRTLSIQMAAPAETPSAIGDERSARSGAVAILHRIELLATHTTTKPGAAPQIIKRHVPVVESLFESGDLCERAKGGDPMECDRHQASLALAYALGLADQGARMARIKHCLDEMRVSSSDVNHRGKLSIGMSNVAFLFRACTKLLAVFSRTRSVDLPGKEDPLKTSARALRAYLNHHTSSRYRQAVSAFSGNVERGTRAINNEVTLDSPEIRSLVDALYAAVHSSMYDELIRAEARIYKDSTQVDSSTKKHRLAFGAHIQQLDVRVARRGNA